MAVTPRHLPTAFGPDDLIPSVRCRVEGSPGDWAMVRTPLRNRIPSCPVGLSILTLVGLAVFVCGDGGQIHLSYSVAAPIPTL